VFTATQEAVPLIDHRLPLLFYSHDALRFGQTARAALVSSLSSHFRVVVVGGEEPSQGSDTLPPVEVVRLRTEGAPDDHDARAQLLLGAYLQLDPAVILIEQFPFGCPELSGDIVSVLEAAAANPRTRLVACSVMDILADRPSTGLRRDDQTRRLADRYFDVVLVHADPLVGRLEDTFEPQALRVPIRYTGFVAPEPARETAPIVLQAHEVVVTCDSARPDGTLFRAAIEACDHWPPGESLPVRIIAGPAVPDWELAGLQAEAASRAAVVIQRSAPDVRAMASCGAVSVSDGACDTVLEMLRTGVPSLIVLDAEDERADWAHHLAALGVVRLLECERLTGAELADEIMATLRLPPPYLDLNRSGAAETLKLVTRLADPVCMFAAHSSG
jgi:predicted glycosyltransferase